MAQRQVFESHCHFSKACWRDAGRRVSRSESKSVRLCVRVRLSVAMHEIVRASEGLCHKRLGL